MTLTNKEQLILAYGELRTIHVLGVNHYLADESFLRVGEFLGFTLDQIKELMKECDKQTKITRDEMQKRVAV